MEPRPSAYAYVRLPEQADDASAPPLNNLAAQEGYCLEGVWIDHGTRTNGFDAMMEQLPATPVKAIFAPSWDDLKAVPRFVQATPSIIRRYFGLPVFTLDVNRDR